ncbi:hypothetical protein DFP93_10913 [Aneurinibacillus soli]|uniref:DUF7852 domain-containing protein n=1 Tax=Aneurinibacillus soli TaxID=1500254 RepID=A0A0U5AVU0_9BACL|nr:DUF3794 domain-containing protein [Aneurinibacillus soli]PYE61314.1 hypothetical protein DFP93_10913 [Aneurinibacillus soli]BAU27857.1 hypothetical protein CB4_02031 [Aneurinibacillus soli]
MFDSCEHDRKNNRMISANQPDCENKPVHPSVTIGHVVMTAPVVLAELNIQVNMDATITFPEAVLEIKDIKKTVKLTQCRLLLPTKKLFIKGFVRKNIQYASPAPEISPSSNRSISSDLHSFTVDIPFDCVTEIHKFLTEPISPEFNHRREFDFFHKSSLPSGHPEKDHLLSNDLSQFHQTSSQHYNELPFCELVYSHIIEWDEAIDRMPLPGHTPIGEGYFTMVEEKMVLDLIVKVLQKQQVRICSATNRGSSGFGDWSHKEEADCSK